MTAKNEHIEALEKMREKLVTARRRFVAEGNVDQAIVHQAQIEAIQRAIDDEKKMLPPPTAVTGRSIRG